MRTAMTAVVACGLMALPVAGKQPGKHAADGVVREIVDWGTGPFRDQITQRVDFARVYLLSFGWTGVADDKLEPTLEKGQVVVFHFTPGHAKNKQSHLRVFALTKDASWRLVHEQKSSRNPVATKITTAEELAKAFPGPK